MLRLFFAVYMFLVGFSDQLFAQNHSPINESELLSELIQLKKELSNKSELKEFYRIQLYSGSRQEAEKSIKEFSKLDLKIDSDIIYETPNFKVWVGFFRTRLEAEKQLNTIKEEFPKALILKPGRS